MTLFASLSLASRIERAECSMLEGGVAAARSRDGGGRCFATPLAGGVAVWAGDGSPLVKVAGVGFAGPLSEAELAPIERAFFERGAPVRFELANLAEPSIADLLTGHGYRLKNFENVLGRSLVDLESPRSAPGVEVRRASDAEAELWLDCVVGGFASPDAEGVPSDEEFPRDVIASVMRDLTAGAGFVRYLASRNGEPAGGASVRFDDGIAQLTGAATLPPHRRRGVQSALLAARLADARAAGCDLAVVTTQPGSKSQENVQRQGFELLYTRAVLVKEPGSVRSAGG